MSRQDIKIHPSGKYRVILEGEELVEDGKMFHMFKFVDDLANGGTQDILIKTGSKELDILFTYSTTGTIKTETFEGTTTSDDGSEITPYNKKRSSTETLETSFYDTPTVTDTGTQISNGLIPGGTKESGSGGTTFGAIKWSFKANTNYLIRFTNTSGGAQDIGIEYQLHE